MSWIRLLRIDELPPGGQRFVALAERELAVFRLAETGEWVVVQNSCPHAGGNLSAGRVEAGVVACPWHEWRFDLRSGVCVHNDQVRVRRYRCRAAEGWLEAWLDG